MKKIIVATTALASVMAFCTTASAEPLGEQGQMAVMSDLQLKFNYTSPKEGDSATAFNIQPALDYFMTDGLSLGGKLGFDYSKHGDDTNWLLGIGPRVGYVLGVTDTIAFWPKLGITFGIGKQKKSMEGMTGAPEFTKTVFSLDVYAPFTLSPVDNFFVGIGPTFSVDLLNKLKPENGDSIDNPEKGLSFGVMSTVGGYF